MPKKKLVSALVGMFLGGVILTVTTQNVIEAWRRVVAVREPVVKANRWIKDAQLPAVSEQLCNRIKAAPELYDWRCTEAQSWARGFVRGVQLGTKLCEVRILPAARKDVEEVLDCLDREEAQSPTWTEEAEAETDEEPTAEGEEGVTQHIFDPFKKVAVDRVLSNPAMLRAHASWIVPLVRTMAAGKEVNGIADLKPGEREELCKLLDLAITVVDKTRPLPLTNVEFEHGTLLLQGEERLPGRRQAWADVLRGCPPEPVARSQAGAGGGSAPAPGRTRWREVVASSAQHPQHLSAPYRNSSRCGAFLFFLNQKTPV